MQTTTTSRLLSRREAAAFLGISPRKLDSLAADGDLPRIKIGSCVRFERNDLNAFVNDRKST